MINLFVDTSYKSLFLALLKDETIIDKIQIMSEFNFSETMIPMLNDLLKKNNISVKDIDKIFVVVGPGSFTGIRIGLTACKVLSYVLNIPIVPISSLQFMATTKVDTKYIIPIIDARHNMVFGGVYDNNCNPIILDRYCPLKELTEQFSGNFTIVTFDENVVDKYILPNYDVEKLIKLHLNDSGENCHSIKPNYLKKTEAEEKMNDSRV